MTPLLTLMQYLSPAFPTGAFAYSHGIEWEVSTGNLRSAAEVQDWLRGVLTYGTGWQDAVLLSLSLRPEADLDALSDLARALQSSAGRMTETMDQGAAFARTVAAMTGRDRPARPLPVAVAEAAAPLGLPAETVIACYLHAFAANLTSVATRFVPLGQTEAQALLAALLPTISDIAARAATAGEDDITSANLAADLAAMAQETLDVRIFRT
jgi:urease accessory protein